MTTLLAPSIRPTRDQVVMACAEQYAALSTCSRNHVGCVVARDHRILSTGYNGAPAGLDHCDHECQSPRSCEIMGSHEANNCPSVMPCITAVHAEVNAIAYAARYGVATAGAVLYVTVAPCLPCSQVIINAGIVRVVYDRPYRLTDGIDLLRDATVDVVALA